MAGIGIEKGGRRIISLEERAQILELLDGQYQVTHPSTFHCVIPPHSKQSEEHRPATVVLCWYVSV